MICGSRCPSAPACQRDPKSESDEYHARDLAQYIGRPAVGAHTFRRVTRAERDDRVDCSTGRVEDQAEHDDLGRRTSACGVDELWQEREEEKRDLWIQNVGDRTLTKDRRERCARHLSRCDRWVLRECAHTQ